MSIKEKGNRKKRINGIGIAIYILCLICTVDLYAQGFGGDDMQNIPGRPGEWILTGNVIISSKGNRIYSDYAEYNEKTTSCVAYGNLRIITKEKVKITGKRLVYDGLRQSYNVIDDVVLEDGQIVMRTPELEFMGNSSTAHYEKGGVMTSGETVLKSKRGDYIGSKQMFHCYNDVLIVNPKYTIWTDTMHYNRSGMATFFGPTNIETDDYYMYSRWGWYNQNKDQVSLKKDAYIKTRESQTLYGDSIYYDLKRKKGDVHKNVFLKDTARNCFIKSDYGENDEMKGYALFTKNPRALLVQNLTDSLFLVSDTMRLTYTTEEVDEKEKKEKKGQHESTQLKTSKPKNIKEIYAFYHARFYKKDVQGKCDSMVYLQTDSMMYMYKDPVLWLGGYQIDGDTIRLWLANQKPNKVWVNPNVFMAGRVVLKEGDTLTQSSAYEVQEGEWFNQIKGKEMWGYFDDSSHFKLADVRGRSEAIYYVVDDKKNELIGVNKSLSKSLKMYFNNADIKGVNLIEPEKTALYPEAILTQRERILKGFHWVSGERPRSQYDLYPDW